MLDSRAKDNKEERRKENINKQQRHKENVSALNRLVRAVDRQNPHPPAAAEKDDLDTRHNNLIEVLPLYKALLCS